jgi:hypothetical protein
MRGDVGQNSNADFPSDAMLKLSYFMFHSAFVLALGKQAWLSSKALNPAGSAVTSGLSLQVSKLSQDYTAYIDQLYSSINAQVSQRMERWHIVDDRIDCVIDIQDNDDDTFDHAPAEWQYPGALSFNYCGSSQHNTATQQANDSLNSLKATYVNYIYGRVVKTASDGRSLQAELDARVVTYRENNARFQNLAKAS